MEQLTELVLVRVTVWLAMLAWLFGSLARSSTKVAEKANDSDRVKTLVGVYGIAWLIGALLLIVHILASYGLVHGFSHKRVLEATAEESFEVTGVRAAWGVYVNLFFASSWLGYSIVLFRRRRRVLGFDSILWWFQLGIVLSATVVFEAGWIRAIALVGVALLILHSAFNYRRIRIASETSSSSD